MTWEWAFLLSIVIVSATAFACHGMVFVKEELIPEEFKDIRLSVEKIIGVQNKITEDMLAMKASQTRIDDLAEETKKMISNANLAAGFKPRGVR